MFGEPYSGRGSLATENTPTLDYGAKSLPEEGRGLHTGSCEHTPSWNWSSGADPGHSPKLHAVLLCGSMGVVSCDWSSQRGQSYRGWAGRGCGCQQASHTELCAKILGQEGVENPKKELKGESMGATRVERGFAVQAGLGPGRWQSR